MTQKQLKGLDYNITQTKCYGKHYLSMCYYLFSGILLFTLLKFESFEECLSLRLSMTIYLCDHPCA